MEDYHVAVGETVSFSKTVGETDIYLFAGITGDFAGNHVNEEYMKKSRYGKRIAHGALMVGYMSTASTLMIDRAVRQGIDATPVSLGYDRVRFVGPVFINDTITVTYTITSIERERDRTHSKVEVTNQDGETVAVAEHILAWVAKESA